MRDRRDARSERAQHLAQPQHAPASRAQFLKDFTNILGLFLGLRPSGSARGGAAILLGIGLLFFVALVLIGGAAWTMKGMRRDPAPAPLWRHYRLEDDH